MKNFTQKSRYVLTSIFVFGLLFLSGASSIEANTSKSDSIQNTIEALETLIKAQLETLNNLKKVAGASVVTSSCSNFIATLKSSVGDTTVKLTESCNGVSISNFNPASVVTVDNTGYVMTDLVIGDTSNLTFIGGSFQSSKGNGPGSPNYAIQLKPGTRNVTFKDTVIELARIGMAVNKVTDLTIDNVTFRKLRSDGISGVVKGIMVTNSRFVESTPIPKTCTISNQPTVYGISIDACTALGGVWKDGDHADAVQVWSTPDFPAGDLVVRNSTVYGDTQGFTTFGPPDKRITNFTVENSDIGTNGFPNLGPSNVDGKIIIRNNKIWRLPGSLQSIPSIDLRGSDNAEKIICGNDIPGHAAALAPYTLPCGSGNPPPPPPPPPTGSPTLTLSVTPASITAGQSSELKWVSTNASSCTASAGWSGTKSTNGSLSVTPTTNTTYTLTCTGSGGSVVKSAAIVVSPTPAPVVSTVFKAGQRVKVSSGPLNIRSTPAATATLKGTQATGALGTIVGTAVKAGGFNWWNIDFDVAPDGWGVETFLVAHVTSQTSTTTTGHYKVFVGDPVTPHKSIPNYSSALVANNCKYYTVTNPKVAVWCTFNGVVVYGTAPSSTGTGTTTPPKPTPTPTPIPKPIKDRDSKSSGSSGKNSSRTKTLYTSEKVSVYDSSFKEVRGEQLEGVRGTYTSDKVIVREDGSEWVKVNFKSGADGYVQKSKVSEASKPVVTERSPNKKFTLVENVNVRETPGGAVKVIQPRGSQGTVRNDVPTVESSGHTWVYVDFGSGVAGYVAKTFVREITSTSGVTPTGTTNTEDLQNRIKILLELIAALKQKMQAGGN